jgi:hypothetical protein
VVQHHAEMEFWAERITVMMSSARWVVVHDALSVEHLDHGIEADVLRGPLLTIVGQPLALFRIRAP